MILFCNSIALAQDLELRVGLLPPAQLGDNAAFNVLVRNTGDETVEGVEAQIILEDGLVYVSNSPTDALFDTQTGNWKVGSLYKNQARTLTIVATFKNRENALLKAEITRSLAPDPDSTPGNGVDTNGNGKIVHDKGDEDDGDAAEINIKY